MKIETLKWIKCFTRSELDPITRHLLHAISMYMDKDGGSCFPSIELLVKDTKLARSTVCDRLKLACDEGWLEKSKHGYQGCQWARNEYQATIPKGFSANENNTEKGSPSNGLSKVKGSPLDGMVKGSPPDRKLQSATQTLTTQRTIKKKEITKVISKKENVPIAEVEVLQVEEWAKEHIPPSIKLEWQLGKFKDYWKASHKKPPRDGVAAFRNWLRNAVEYQAKAQHSSKATARHKDFEQQDYYANTDGFRTE